MTTTACFRIHSSKMDRWVLAGFSPMTLYFPAIEFALNIPRSMISCGNARSPSYSPHKLALASRQIEKASGRALSDKQMTRRELNPKIHPPPLIPSRIVDHLRADWIDRLIHHRPRNHRSACSFACLVLTRTGLFTCMGC